MHSDGRAYALMDHEIGSYIDTDDANFNPNTKWGGVWELDQTGTVLVSKSSTSGSAFNVAADTVVGEEKHKLSVDEMPLHNHIEEFVHNYTNYFMAVNYNNMGSFQAVIPEDDGTFSKTVKEDLLVRTSDNGGSQSHNNIQPSKVIYRWHRTA